MQPKSAAQTLNSSIKRNTICSTIFLLEKRAKGPSFPPFSAPQTVPRRRARKVNHFSSFLPKGNTRTLLGQLEFGVFCFESKRERDKLASFAKQNQFQFHSAPIWPQSVLPRRSSLGSLWSHWRAGSSSEWQRRRSSAEEWRLRSHFWALASSWRFVGSFLASSWRPFGPAGRPLRAGECPPDKKSI